jgi:hypothetical protein
MPEPKRPAVNRTRERRIEDEIVVDAYGPEERALGWHCYLEEKLPFPFNARCTTEHPLSPLKKGERVEAVGMAPEDVCAQGMHVMVRSAGRTFGVPLAQLAIIGGAEEARTALADWHYWVARGYEF